MARKELLDLGWQLSQNMAKLLTLQLYDPKVVEQAQLDDLQDHLEVVELLLTNMAGNWKT